MTSSLSSLLVNSCCTVTPPSGKSKSRNQKTVYAQYEQRLFLRPIMSTYAPSRKNSQEDKPNDDDEIARRDSLAESSETDFEFESETDASADADAEQYLDDMDRTYGDAADDGSTTPTHPSSRTAAQPTQALGLTRSPQTQHHTQTHSIRPPARTAPLPPTTSAEERTVAYNAGQRGVTYECAGRIFYPGKGRVTEPCGQMVELRKGEAVRCWNCGGRMMYKVRTKRMVQFLAV